MSLSQRWAEWQGLIWPESKDVRQGASLAGLRAMLSVYPTFRSIGEGIANEGVAYITTIALGWNSGEGGEAFVEGWNGYVNEYRACKQSFEQAGDFNYQNRGMSKHRSCLEHAKRHANWKYVPTMVQNMEWDDPRRGWDDPREETWGYQTPASPNQLFGAGLRVVTAAASKGSGPVSRSLRRDVARGLGAIRNQGPPTLSGSTPATPASPTPAPVPSTPAPVSPYTVDTGSIGQYRWLLLPAGLILLSRRS